MKIESKKRALDKIYKRRDRYEIPDWQREEVGYADYQNLITDLYFVFWEGVGDRLKGKMSTSFVDINSLRTDLQHDLDHGKAKKSASKREKYLRPLANTRARLHPQQPLLSTFLFSRWDC